MSSSSWTQEEREKAVELYEELEPTPATTTECVKTVADALEKSPNAVRMVLSQQNVYIKKEVQSSGSKSSSNRVSKQDALNELRSAITDLGQEPSDEIIDKMTGKAALYFTNVLRSAMSDD